jgi:hypothetical protein
MTPAVAISDRLRAALPLLAVLVAGCYDFHLTGPEDAPQVSPPGLVKVTVEYRQPPGCLGGGHCDDRVVFFGSWMRPGTEFGLTPDPGNFVWRGLVYGVPVNFPPKNPPQPYEVRIYDPHLLASPTSGFTGDNLTLGTETLDQIQHPGTPAVHDLVYIDANGFGHNAF